MEPIAGDLWRNPGGRAGNPSGTLQVFFGLKSVLDVGSQHARARSTGVNAKTLKLGDLARLGESAKAPCFTEPKGAGPGVDFPRQVAKNNTFLCLLKLNSHKIDLLPEEKRKLLFKPRGRRQQRPAPLTPQTHY